MSTDDFDKYFYYNQSVQSPEADMEFFAKTYKELRGEEARVFGEDFCGTFANCCAWVKKDPERQAYGIDLDQEPLNYGRQNYLAKLAPSEQQRIQLFEADVLGRDFPGADIICGLNFSYFGFKDRPTLKRYFEAAKARLNPGGLFIVDCFGGSKCLEANEEETEDPELGYSYFWDQDEFDPISNESYFHIHFKRKGERKRKNVFNYDWRLWSIPEIRDLFAEVGFQSSVVYWEGNDEDGDGNGVFSRTDVGEECEAWVAYIVGVV